MNFIWKGSNEDPSGTASFRKDEVKLQVNLEGFHDAVGLRNLMDVFYQAGVKEGQRDLLSKLHFDLRQEYKPLSVDRILEIEENLMPLDTTEKVLAFARSIERLHGVTKEK